MNKRGNLWPASIGLSVLVPAETRAVKATVRFAEYVLGIDKPEGRGRGKRSQTCDALLHKAEDARRRITEGIELLASDGQVRQAFCLANRAMAEAALHRSPGRYGQRAAA